MISRDNKLTNMLMSVVYKDLKDPTVIRINMDAAASVLAQFGYTLPRKTFEAKLQQLVNNKLVGSKLTPATSFQIAQLIIKLADILNVQEKDIMKTVIEDEEMSAEDQAKYLEKKIQEWRQEYYGSMDSKERENLLKNTRLRPEIAEKIKKA